MLAAADAVRTIDPPPYVVIELVEGADLGAMHMRVGCDCLNPREARILVALGKPEAKFEVVTLRCCPSKAHLTMNPTRSL
jgi:hypothetical protein